VLFKNILRILERNGTTDAEAPEVVLEQLVKGICAVNVRYEL
jgi:hypothetical protein